MAKGKKIQQAPLSYHQQRLWFLDEFEGSNVYESSPVYHNVPLMLRIAGTVDTVVLERALHTVVARHAALRTIISDSNGDIFQAITERVGPEMAIVEGCSSMDEALAMTRELCQRPFQLDSDMLVRAAFYPVNEEQSLLVIVLHHIIADRASLQIIARELGEAYSVAKSGVESKLPDLPIQYGDYAAWQRSLSDEVLEPYLFHWRWQLRGEIAALELPEDRRRPAVQTYTGGSHEFSIDEETVAAVRELAGSRGKGVFDVLLCCFNVLLHRYSRQDNIVVGTSDPCRSQPGTEKVVGPFANLLALRSDLSANELFSALLDKTVTTVKLAREHCEMPFDKLVQMLKPQNDMSRTALFDVLFNYYDGEEPTISMNGAKASIIDTNLGYGKYDINLCLRSEGAAIFGAAVYNHDIYDGRTIEQMMRHFLAILASVCADPCQGVDDIDMLAHEEISLQLTKWNDTARSYPQDKCLHHAFEEQVARTPDAPALVYEEETLTYAELNERADQLAACLRSRGVVPETLVGVCMKRSIEMVVSLYGILKSGGAYVPVDPDYPADRIQYMLDDSGVSILLTQAELASELAGLSQCDVLCVDSEWDELVAAGKNASQTWEDAGPRNLAYMIYTSGSTGRPKGAMNEHRGICNRLFWGQEQYQMRAGAKVLQKTPFSFDVSIWEFFWPLQVGATLVVARPGGHQDSDYLVQLICEQKITTIHFVPSMLQVFIEADGVEKCVSLRRVFCSGEALPHDLQERFFERCQAELHNLYGPTEAGVEVTYWECVRGGELGIVPIGKPVGNTQVYILDSKMRPVPVGVPGELHIGGIQVCRGYRNRPDLTAEKFVLDPFAAEQDARLYKTGDLCRFMQDGNVEYLGRLDFQVKIRGLRIELGEIEAELTRHPGVREAVVVVKDMGGADKWLVAYLVFQKDASRASDSELRAHLSERLPDYMVPAIFVVMATFPLNLNGKVDRRALPAPSLDSGTDEDDVAPRTETEESLCEIWREVLKLDYVGVNRSFFVLGGHSLLATQVVARIRDRFGIEMSVRTLFEKPTVLALAEHLDGASDVAGDERWEIGKVPRDGHLPVSFTQERLWFLNKLEGGSAIYNVPAALKVTGALDVSALERSLNEIVCRHESLRTSFNEIDGRPSSEVADEVAMELPLLDLGSMSEPERDREVARLARDEAREPFDISGVPLLRMKLIRLADEEHVVLLTMHHIISDGWSIGIFIREITELYRAFACGEPARLDELPVQFVDFAAWQRERLAGDARDELLEYWRGHLSGAPPLLELPSDRPRPPVKSFRGGSRFFVIEQGLVGRLRALGRELDTSLFMVLLAAFDVLVHRYSGQDDVVIGSPIANRERQELEGLIGFFVNMLAIRCDLSGNPAFIDLLHRVRQSTLDAYAHQDMPFEQIVDELQPGRNLGHTPVFQVVFALQNVPVERLELPGLSLDPMEVDNGTSKFDLVVLLHETDDGLTGLVEYSSDLFEAETVDRMMSHYRILLESIAQDPRQPVSGLPMISNEERSRLLTEWSGASVAYPRDKCVHEVFAEQAGKTPDAIALVSGSEEMTYSELNERSDRIADYLAGLGVGREDLVGVSIERSSDLIVTLLGILKAGAAYVPFDPDYPADRIRYMIEDSGVKILLTREATMASLPVVPGARVVAVDSDWEKIKAAPRCERESVPATSLVYVMYTSGSTGRPKGTSVVHRGVVRLVRNTSYVELSEDEVFLQFAPISFDASTFEIWGCLLNGGKLVIMPPDAPSLADLGRVIRESGVSVLWLTSSLFNLMVDEQLDALKSVRQVLAGGDVLSVPHVLRFIEESAGSKLINGYGPTENTTFTCCYPMASKDDVGNTVSIGRPITNTRVFIVDGFMQPVPTGVYGELMIGGDGLARDYLNRPDLTVEKFVDNPFNDGGSRLYRTGDLARFLPDGRIEFLGRKDNQVKIRGFRVELGEIEAELLQLAAVRDAVVVAREDRPGQKQLVAYLVPADGFTVCADEVKGALADRLPDYMVPACSVQMDRLPLSPNGKVDRKALPAPDLDGAPGEYRAPRSDVEETLARIWSEVLGVARVGVDDNFFDLGGHSLLATQAVSRTSESFRVELALRRIFELPTIAQLGHEIERLMAVRDFAAEDNVAAGEREEMEF